MSRARLSEVLKFLQALVPDAHTVGAINGDGIDAKGFRSATFFSLYGTSGTSLDVRVQDSDDDGSSDAYADVTGALITQQVAGAELALINVNCEQTKRWLRVVVDAGGTEDVAVACVLGNPEQSPADNTGLDEVVNTH